MARALPGVTEEARVPGGPVGGSAAGRALPRVLWTAPFPRRYLHFPPLRFQPARSGLLLSLRKGDALLLTGQGLIPVLPLHALDLSN